jgi:ribonuclease HI
MTLATVDNGMEAPLEPLHVAQEVVHEESSYFKEESTTLATVDNEMEATEEAQDKAPSPQFTSAAADTSWGTEKTVTVSPDIETTINASREAENGALVMSESVNDAKIEIALRVGGVLRKNPEIGGGVGVELLCSVQGQKGMTENQNVRMRKFFTDKITRNQLEYGGVIHGLEEALNIIKQWQTTHSVDSIKNCDVTMLIGGEVELVLKQLSGDDECKNKKLLPLYDRASELLSNLKKLGTASASFERVYRKNNTVAHGEFHVVTRNSKQLPG